MARVRRLIVFVVCVCVSLLADAGALAPDGGGGLWPTAAIAYSQCVSMAAAQDTTGGGFCRYNSGFGTPSSRAECINYNPAMGNYSGSYSAMNKAQSVSYGAFYWCVATSCNVGASPDGQTDYAFADPGGGVGAGATVSSSGGCCESIVLSQSSWSASNKSDAVTVGHFALTGGYCNANYSTSSGGSLPVPPTLKPFQYCAAGVTGCYNTFKDAFCAQTQSGEWNCIPRTPTNDQGGCASGATGSECYSKNGNPVPAPPDPPIQKGTPPDVTNNYTITNTSTTNNYTSSSYSGTSPGPGPASGSSSSSSVSPGGTGSNSTGSGNSGKGGTDSTGKCANGSVPTASGCSGTYRDDGCDHPPACFGDAVLCGIAANTHKAACNPSSGTSVGSPSSALAAAGVPADGGASGDPSASGLVTSSDLGSDGFDSSGLGFSRSCPANPNFSVLGHSYTLDLTPFCNFAGMLGWFVLLIAYLAGLRIVATGKA